MRRGLIALLLVAAATAVPAASAGTAPGLGGEQLTAAHTTILSCDVSDRGGSFTYEATGTATGPYAGTFTETGTATVGPVDSAYRQQVTALSGQFTIDSPAGQVTATHAFQLTGPSGVNVPTGACLDGWSGVSASLFVFQNALRYDATIEAPGGLGCTASGPGLLGFTQGSSVLNDSFSETLYNDVPSSVVCAGSDTTPPTLSVPADLTVDATSADGAVVDFAATATDDTDPAPSVGCDPASGSTFPIGTTTVTCTAADASGNVSEPATFTVTVRGAADQVAAELGTGFPGLEAKRRAILADVQAGRTNAACGVLGAFGNQVEALAGARLDDADAAALLATVARVQTLLGC
jgi:hypothetical protein